MENGKQLVRNEINRLKQSLPDGAAAYLSQKICGRLIQTEAFQKARCIALYHAIKGEVRTLALLEEWYGKKKIALPAISGGNMNFHLYAGKENLVAGALNIPEPDISGKSPAEMIPAEDIELFVVPGIAFDRECNRLGRGKGYYDRFLSGTDKPIIGLCFGFQLMERIPAEAHDRKMTMVITEDATVSSHRQSHPNRHVH
ncbi:MAG: 5-formyltetrahydrofolate cyclo-ligase [Tannerella sp.]|jgi:5-formyltetrahydrofolate cyclo-ligase|nr:5-formyltetrahydrofolate cyclo-ligase [Tannerella sp.]